MLDSAGRLGWQSSHDSCPASICSQQMDRTSVKSVDGKCPAAWCYTGCVMQNTQPIAGRAPALQLGPPVHLLGTLLLATMITALVAMITGAVGRLFPDWQGVFLVAACFLIAVEAALVRYRMREGRHLSTGALPYLAAELFTLTVLMRIVSALGLGLEALPALAESWVRSPLTAIDGPFIACLVAGLLCAIVMRIGLYELGELDPPAGPIKTEYALDAEIARSREEADERGALARLATGIAWGGILALLALAARVADLRPWGEPGAPLSPWMALAGIAYLAAGALLYSQARLDVLRARWHRDEATVEAGVVARWRWLSAAVVVCVVALGLVLPRSYGAELLAAARIAAIAAVNLLGLTALALGLVAIGALGLALTIPAFLLALLGGFGSTPLPTGPIEPLPAPTPPPTTTYDPPLGPGLVFWACMALLAGYALWIVLRRQSWAVAAFERLRTGLAPVTNWLRRFWGGAAGYARKVGEAVAERLRRPPPPPPRPRRRGLRQLNPAELVRYFYASTVTRAERGGLGRNPADTPYEYGAKLRDDLPDAAEDVNRLTEAYLAAAYAPRSTSPDEAKRARGPWERLKRRLRGR